MFTNSAPLAGMRCLWVTNVGAAEITLNSIQTLLTVAPDLRPFVNIGCIDPATIDYFTARLPDARLLNFDDMPDWRAFASVEVEGDYSNYGTVKFRDVSFARYFALIRLMEEEDAPVLYADGDIAFRRDPRAEIVKAAATPGASALFQSDLLLREDSEFDANGFMIRAPHQRPYHCTGFSVWSSAARAIELSQEILLQRDLENEDTHDQHALKTLPFNKVQDLAPLPAEGFPNGSHFFERDGGFKYPAELIEHRLSKACIVHANWIVGLTAKIAALKSVGLWRL